MGMEGPVVTGEAGGWSVTTNAGTAADIASLGKKEEPAKPEEKPDTSKAAAELGRLGGEAAAKKRAADAREAKKAELAEEQEEKQEAKPADEEKGEAKTEEAKDEPKPGEKPLGKPRDDPRARMLEATRKESEAKKALAAERAERERDRAEMQHLRAEFDALKRGEQPEAQAKPKIFDPSKPEPEDFDDYGAYLDARDEWNMRRLDDRRRQESAASERDEHFASQAETFVSKIKEALPDFKERIAPEILELKPHFQLARGESPTGENFLASELFYEPETAPAIMLYLSEHPDEFQRIAALSNPRAVSREVAKIEARLEAAIAGNSPEPEKTVSKASPPIKPVSGAAYVAESDEYKEGMSFDEYARLRSKQVKARR